MAQGIWPVLKYPVILAGSLPVLFDRARAEARSITITETDLPIANLPPAFDGVRFAFLSDWHCSRQSPPSFLREVVEETNRQRPEIILLGGDYITGGTRYIEPVGEVLSGLRAPLGVYGVMGNHDFWDNHEGVKTRSMLQRVGIILVDNSGRWVHVDGGRLRIGGVGDFWEDEQDLGAALAGVRPDEKAILLSHNPDYAMKIRDPRVGLVLSGHTHGGQIRLPRIGPVITNSQHGRKLVAGLVQFETFKLYTSRGLGTVVVPLRLESPPEIAFFTLRKQ
ncbi:MAG: metallophosphoesterase [Rudaea sp.]